MYQSGLQGFAKCCAGQLRVAARLSFRQCRLYTCPVPSAPVTVCLDKLKRTIIEFTEIVDTNTRIEDFNQAVTRVKEVRLRRRRARVGKQVKPTYLYYYHYYYNYYYYYHYY